jgi:hypothetical protein
VKVTQTIATGVLLGWMCQSSMSAPPAIERPSPPPCCADGQCFASPMTYGYYDTRWRRWPMESLAQASAQKPAALSAPLQKEIAPFIVPPAEQEDRKAPPPSVPAGEQTPAGAPRTQGAPGGPTPPQGFQQPAGTGAPAGQPRGTTGGLPTPPQTVPLAPPAGQGTQPTTQPYKSVSPDSPLNRSGSGPMGDSDPPPSLPFGPALVAPEQASRDVSQQPAVVPRRSPSVQPVNAPSSDPPPAPPIALASYEE